MREIWLMRHAQAGIQAASDELRPLTPTGLQQVVSVADKIGFEGNFDLWASPFLRTQQTADALQSASPRAEFERTSEALLRSESDPILTAELINASAANRLILVSHMPLVANLLVTLSDDTRIGGFQTAQIVHCAQLQPGEKWQLRAVYSPTVG